MEESSAERVVKPKRRLVQKNRSLTDSSQSQPRNATPTKKQKPKKQKKKKEEELEEDFYTLKGILEEKEENGRILYLIDWDDNPYTGEVYDNSWVCICRHLSKPS